VPWPGTSSRAHLLHGDLGPTRPTAYSGAAVAGYGGAVGSGRAAAPVPVVGPAGAGSLTPAEEGPPAPGRGVDRRLCSSRHHQPVQPPAAPGRDAGWGTVEWRMLSPYVDTGGVSTKVAPGVALSRRRDNGHHRPDQRGIVPRPSASVTGQPQVARSVSLRRDSGRTDTESPTGRSPTPWSCRANIATTGRGGRLLGHALAR
jgi:hypothetical protein